MNIGKSIYDEVRHLARLTVPIEARYEAATPPVLTVRLHDLKEWLDTLELMVTSGLNDNDTRILVTYTEMDKDEGLVKRLLALVWHRHE